MPAVPGWKLIIYQGRDCGNALHLYALRQYKRDMSATCPQSEASSANVLPSGAGTNDAVPAAMSDAGPADDDIRDIDAGLTPQSRDTPPRAPLLRRAIRGRRLPENLRTTVRLDRRTLIGRDAAAFRARLVAHCAGAPTATQAALIETAVQIRMRLIAMDIAFAQKAGQSAHDARQYLAWSNSLTRTLSLLGLQPTAAAAAPPSLADYISAKGTPTDDR